MVWAAAIPAGAADWDPRGIGGTGQDAGRCRPSHARRLFDDERVVVGVGAKDLRYQTLLRIPAGTVAFEELACRGVLLDLLRGPFSPEAALAADSILFGLWHIVPTVAAANANGVTGPRRVTLVGGLVLATSVGGSSRCSSCQGTPSAGAGDTPPGVQRRRRLDGAPEGASSGI